MYVLAEYFSCFLKAPTWLRHELEEGLEAPVGSDFSWSPVYATSEPATMRHDMTMTSEEEHSFLSTRSDTLRNISTNSSQNESTMSSSDALQYSSDLGQQEYSFRVTAASHVEEYPNRRLIGMKSNRHLMDSSGLIPATIAENESESRTGSRISLDKPSDVDNYFNRHPPPAELSPHQLIKGAVSVANLPLSTPSQVLNVKKTHSTTDIRRDGEQQLGTGSTGRVKLKSSQSSAKVQGKGGGGGGGGGGGRGGSAVGRGHSKAMSAGSLGNEKKMLNEGRRRASEEVSRGGGATLKGAQK